MYDMVKQSPLLSHLDVHLIPFGIDLKRFAISDGRDARKRLKIPEGNIVVSFRADQSPYKGFDHVKDSLQRLSVDVPVTLLSVGHPSLLESYRKRFHVIDMGWLTDDDIMLDVYRSTDIFLMPSMAEAFGMMAMEAMACGKPVIVFEGTSLPEVVFAPEGGVAVPQGHVDALTSELEWLISHKEKRMKLGAQARKIAEQHYDKDIYVSRMIDLYKEVIEKRKNSDRSKYILEQLKKASQKSQTMKNAAVSGICGAPSVQNALEGSNPIAELALIKSSVYYRVYDKLRKRPALRFVSNAVIKPSICFSWKVLRNSRRLVRRFLF
jgi:hypothetical protein